MIENQIIQKIEDLPTLPEVATHLSQAIADPMSSSQKVEEILSKDLALTAKVLRMVNSAYYAIPGGVKSLSRAIHFLGFDTIHQLALSVQIFSTLEHLESPHFSLREFWKHSIGVGMASETIAKISHTRNASDLFVAGLVHDIGKVIYVWIEPDQFKQILQTASQKRISMIDAELELGLPSHAEVGFWLAQHWKLPSLVQQVIRWHHEKEPSVRQGVPAEAQVSIDQVYLANLFIHGLNFGESGHRQVISAPKPIFDRLNLNPKALPELSKQISRGLSSAEAFLKVLGSKKEEKAA